MTENQTPEGNVITITPTTPVRKTWGQHGKPLGGWQFFGTEVKAPAAEGKTVAKVVVEGTTVVLKGGNGRPIADAAFAVTTKFWAVVPEDATRVVEAPKPPREKTEPAGPIEITAPKGGDLTVPPIKGAVAQAIKDSGQSLNAISRAHGLNPSQMRRLVNDQVAKVDLTRAQAIATALGQPVGKVFGAATEKAAAAKNGTPQGGQAPATDTPKGGRKSRASRATRAADRMAAAPAPEAEAEGTEPKTDEAAE